MSLQSKIPKKIDLTPKKHHGFHAIIILFGFLLPPIAVAVRFGIGFFYKCLLDYLWIHGHNFYIQNIRNNENRGRTPKWAIKAGMIDTENLDRRKRKNAWATRYDERNLESAHIGQDLEEGEEGENYAPQSEADRIRAERRQREGLWADTDAEYYNEEQEAPNQRHWHYPANFEGAEPPKELERNQARRGSVDSITGASAYPTSGGGGGHHDDDVPEWGRDYGSQKKPSKNPFNRKKSKPTASDWHDNGASAPAQNGRGYADDVALDDAWAGASSGRSGGGGGGRSNGNAQPAPAARKANGDPNWEHEF